MSKDLGKLGAWAILIHALGLVAFLSVSAHLPNPVLKMLAIATTVVAAIAVLLVFTRKRSGVAPIVVAALIMAISYQVAFHLVGLLGFKGLLRDAGGADYMIPLVEVTGLVFAAYLAIAGVLALVVQNTRPNISTMQ